MTATLRDDTRRCLDRMEGMIDSDHLARVAALHADCRHYRPIPYLPTAVFWQAPDWPTFDFEEIQHDMEKMLLSQLAATYSSCILKDDRLPSIRANYGTGILPSLFGCQIRTFEKNLPCALPLHSTERVRELIAAGVPDLRGGQGGRVFDTVAFYREALAGYPKLARHVNIDLADIQGTLDAAEIVWGSEMMLAMYDEPELVHQFLALVTATIRQFMLAHQKIDHLPFDGQCSIWGSLGRMCIREDASVNLSGAMYDEFARPYTQQLLDEFGGCIHWCGDGKAWWRSIITLRRLSAVNPYQGHFYDPLDIYQACRAAGVSIWQWTTPLLPAAREQIRTGWSMIAWAKDLESAQKAYCAAATGKED